MPDPGARAPAPRRFSALGAPERAVVDTFLDDARPWAARRAARAYGHLPVELREQAIDGACLELRTASPPSLDRRTLYGHLAEALTRALREAHTGWCLNHAAYGSRFAEPAGETTPADRPLAAFVDEGLGGMERAVLQLEIGAGRDTATARAALRLGPRQYRHHRDEGLAKLRGAIGGIVRGRVCDDHLQSVTLAATGDREAAASLSAGADRCRSCAREATSVRRVLGGRLALAPWPLVIKPAGMLTAKLGALGAMATGKATGAGALGAAGAAKGVAAVLLTAALATGSAATVSGSEGEDRAAKASSPVVADESSQRPRTAASPRRPSRGARRRAAAESEPARRARPRPTRATVAPEVTTTASPAPFAPAAEPPLSETVTDTVDKTVKDLRKTVDDTTAKLPPVPSKDRTLDVQKTVEDVTGAVGGLLAP